MDEVGSCAIEALQLEVAFFHKLDLRFEMLSQVVEDLFFAKGVAVHIEFDVMAIISCSLFSYYIDQLVVSLLLAWKLFG